MRRYLKTLTEVLEVVPGESGGRKAKRCGESMHVQLDRWRLLQKETDQHVTVVSYEVSTFVEPDAPGSKGMTVNTMSILYVKAEEMAAYGVMSGMDPIEWKMYQDIGLGVGDRLFSGRILFLCPTPLTAFLRGADPEISGFKRGDADPTTFGSDLYSAVIADRELSRSVNPIEVVAAVKEALQDGGAFLVVEDSFTHPETLWSFSEEGLRFLLKDFKIKKQKSCGNLLGVVHKLASGGSWLPTHPHESFFRNDPSWPIYTWALAHI